MTDPPTRLTPVGTIEADDDGGYRIVLCSEVEGRVTKRDLGAVRDTRLASRPAVEAALLRALVRDLRRQAKAWIKGWPHWLGEG